MTEEKIFELANRLLEKTRDGTQHWEASVSDQSFLTSFPKYSVKIGRMSDEYGENWTTVISIYNEAGTELEAASEDMLRQRLGGFEVPVVLKELYEAARRSALNVEGALDDLLANLR